MTTRPYRSSQEVPAKPARCAQEIRAWVMETNRVPSAGDPVCLCFRCGVALTDKTMTVDRIVPGAHGGTYRRNNVRPACRSCNSKIGGGTMRKTRMTAF